MNDRRPFLSLTRTLPGLLTVFAAMLLLASEVLAGVASTSTTSTTFGGTTTTTMFTPTDITGGGRFEGGFPEGSFDSYSFELTEPRVLVAEITNGFGGCPGDSYLELRQLGGPGNCQGEYGPDLPCIAFDDDSGVSLCSLLAYRIDVPGIYEIRVSAFGGGKITRYFMDVDFVETECGNGATEILEECDDGNLEDNDCCSSECTLDGAGAPCSDGVFCNGPDTCDSEAQCSQHAGDPCVDGDPCTTDVCTEETDECSHEPVVPCSSTTTTTLPAAPCGDISGDGSVKAGDALSVLKAAVGGDECSAAPCLCDANGDDKISAPDAQLVLKAAVGVTVELLCPC